MGYSIQDVKDSIEIEDVYTLLEELGAEPRMYSDYIVSKTVCHDGDSSKLYYYNDSGLFHCYTGECGTFDIVELIQKVKHIEDLQAAIYYAVNFFNLQWKISDKDDIDYNEEDWHFFDRQEELREKAREQEKFKLVELQQYDDSILKYYPQPIIKDWAEEGITKEICDFMNIRYDPVECSILIPHYDDNSRLVGIRRRALVKEDEAVGKYRPWKKQELYNHPLSFNLYGLEASKWNIQRSGLAVVVESEKSVLQYLSYFGLENSVAVAVCGSTFSKYQFELLSYYGAKEIVIAFDKDYYNSQDIENYDHFVSKMKKLGEKFDSRCNLSFIVDSDKNLLGYKNSPLDKGKEIFLDLFKNRKYLKQDGVILLIINYMQNQIVPTQVNSKYQPIEEFLQKIKINGQTLGNKIFMTGDCWITWKKL